LSRGVVGALSDEGGDARAHDRRRGIGPACRFEVNEVYANVASGALIIIGSLFAVLGLFGGRLEWAALGLLAVFGGGALSLLAKRLR
jgi:VIT1/CCC1 family predicted Fe2+/Mn2+ transporter